MLAFECSSRIQVHPLLRLVLPTVDLERKRRVIFLSITTEDDNSSRIELHSESRLGYGDLGVNPERLELFYEALASD